MTTRGRDDNPGAIERGRHRPGAVRLRINNGEADLRVTLGALAEMEQAFGGDLTKIGERLKQPSVADIILILHALLRGGGSAITLAALQASDIDLAEASRAIGRAFSHGAVMERTDASHRDQSETADISVLNDGVAATSPEK